MYHWEIREGDIVAAGTRHEPRYVRVLEVRPEQVYGTAINGSAPGAGHWPRHLVGGFVGFPCCEVRAVSAEEIVSRRIEVNRGARGRRFYPTVAELKRGAGLFKAAHARDSGALVIAAHYEGERDYWVAGYGTKGALAGIWAYSRSSHAGNGGKWEYFDLVELERCERGCCGAPGLIYRDTDWQPGPAREVIPGYREE